MQIFLYWNLELSFTVSASILVDYTNKIQVEFK